MLSLGELRIKPWGSEYREDNHDRGVRLHSAMYEPGDEEMKQKAEALRWSGVEVMAVGLRFKKIC